MPRGDRSVGGVDGADTELPAVQVDGWRPIRAGQGRLRSGAEPSHDADEPQRVLALAVDGAGREEVPQSFDLGLGRFSCLARCSVSW
jgi:hypothetical protein